MNKYFSTLKDYIAKAEFDEVKEHFGWFTVYTKYFKIYDEYGYAGCTTMWIRVYNDGHIAVIKSPARGVGFSRRYSWDDNGKFKIET